MNPEEINRKSDSTDDAVVEDNSADNKYQNEASSFIKETSLDKMIEIAEIAKMKKMSEPPKWVIPDEI